MEKEAEEFLERMEKEAGEILLKLYLNMTKRSIISAEKLNEILFKSLRDEYDNKYIVYVKLEIIN